MMQDAIEAEEAMAVECERAVGRLLEAISHLRGPVEYSVEVNEVQVSPEEFEARAPGLISGMHSPDYGAELEILPRLMTLADETRLKEWPESIVDTYRVAIAGDVVVQQSANTANARTDVYVDHDKVVYYNPLRASVVIYEHAYEKMPDLAPHAPRLILDPLMTRPEEAHLWAEIDWECLIEQASSGELVSLRSKRAEGGVEFLDVWTFADGRPRLIFLNGSTFARVVAVSYVDDDQAPSWMPRSVVSVFSGPTYVLVREYRIDSAWAGSLVDARLYVPDTVSTRVFKNGAFKGIGLSSIPFTDRGALVSTTAEPDSVPSSLTLLGPEHLALVGLGFALVIILAACRRRSRLRAC